MVQTPTEYSLLYIMADGKPVLEYKDRLKQEAEELLLTGFPATIVKLNALLETPQFKDGQFIDVHQDLNIPIPDSIVFNIDSDFPSVKNVTSDTSISQDESKSNAIIPLTEVVPTNKRLVELVETVKPHIRKLVEDSNIMKMWISILIPKVEDGNNFGVSIQEDTLAEVQYVEAEASAFFNQISRYFFSRAKLISEVGKYPYIEDYRRAVQEIDEKEYLRLLLVMHEIKNRYCTLHDIVVKNLDKIKKPRSANAAESLY